MSCPNVSCSTVTTGFAPQTFASAIQFFTAAQCLITEDWPTNYEQDDADTNFDFIIVGAGSAGSVLAHRLSELEKWRILLIEGGGDPPEESIIPGFHLRLYNTKYDWQYQTVNDGRTNAANINGSILWPRGKLLGGCSSINGMIYVRGNDQDYQNWYDAGNTDWDLETVKKYFKKLENLQDEKLLSNPTIGVTYGYDGPLVINTFNITYNDVIENVLKAYDEIGIKNLPDLNTGNAIGSGRYTVTAANGKRISTAKAYLNTIKSRSNLHVLKDTLVTKILIDDENSAYGVEVNTNGTKTNYHAKKEVIISAGAINTPKLLMLSGIGPKKHLNLHNITTIVDLPGVGQNLQDHIAVPITIYGKEPGADDTSKTYLDGIMYLYNNTGYLAHATMANVIAFFTSNETTYPKFQNHLTLFPKNATTKVRFYAGSVAKFKDSVTESLVTQNLNNTLYLFNFNLLHPYSRGNISLSSNNPLDHPLIYPNYLSDERDLQETAEGIRILTEIVNSSYFQSIDSFLGRIDWEPCNALTLNSIEYWKCIAINTVLTVFHPVGTAQMGSDLTTAVVSSRLKVHNVTNLRVVDASVMPSTISGNTNAAVIMIAERASDIIKEDHGEC